METALGLETDFSFSIGISCSERSETTLFGNLILMLDRRVGLEVCLCSLLTRLSYPTMMICLGRLVGLENTHKTTGTRVTATSHQTHFNMTNLHEPRDSKLGFLPSVAQEIYIL